MTDIRSFWIAVPNPIKPEKGKCYLYYADLQFPMEICPVAGQYNIPLGKDKDARALKNEMEVIINDSTSRGKNIMIAYVKDEVIGIFCGD